MALAKNHMNIIINPYSPLIDQYQPVLSLFTYDQSLLRDNNGLTIVFLILLTLIMMNHYEPRINPY